MELWGKQCAYIPRRFVWSKWSSSSSSITCLGSTSWPEVLPGSVELGDSHRREPRQVSAVTPLMTRWFVQRPKPSPDSSIFVYILILDLILVY
jgi:hypothetical protein